MCSAGTPLVFTNVANPKSNNLWKFLFSGYATNNLHYINVKPKCIPWWLVQAHGKVVCTHACSCWRISFHYWSPCASAMATSSRWWSILVKHGQIPSKLQLHEWWNAREWILSAFYLINLTCQKQSLTRYKFQPMNSLSIQDMLFPSMHPLAFAVNSSVCMSVSLLRCRYC